MDRWSSIESHPIRRNVFLFHAFCLFSQASPAAVVARVKGPLTDGGFSLYMA
ncbi:hypothetical protein M440DRAFT_277493 [Trichoderma longibrachiatum ATCC 18648]|uniref:Uncharacterized protein n=1 Tax=Trichoderma longibrachiatum ATCC 18648 TaxID=983965 RepID=A0A2T4C711_TRILO|nr:hypothetical protein M440DRAFT_277493 [Trichoderma longibrachiatum ATCC 18648]